MRRSQNLEIFSEKKIHMALRSVQFLASFISFCFEILSYLAYGEKIIRLASKNKNLQILASAHAPPVQKNKQTDY